MAAIFTLESIHARSDLNDGWRLENNEPYSDSDIRQLLLYCETLMKPLEALLYRYDPENPGAALEPDAGCIECTSGATPNNHNTGPCPYHQALAALELIKRGGSRDNKT